MRLKDDQALQNVIGRLRYSKLDSVEELTQIETKSRGPLAELLLYFSLNLNDTPLQKPIKAIIANKDCSTQMKIALIDDLIKKTTCKEESSSLVLSISRMLVTENQPSFKDEYGKFKSATTTILEQTTRDVKIACHHTKMKEKKTKALESRIEELNMQLRSISEEKDVLSKVCHESIRASQSLMTTLEQSEKQNQLLQQQIALQQSGSTRSHENEKPGPLPVLLSDNTPVTGSLLLSFWNKPLTDVSSTAQINTDTVKETSYNSNQTPSVQ